MSIELKYIASSGNEYNLKTDGIKSRTANYHVWNWVPNGTQLQFGQRLANFSRNAATYTTKLFLTGSVVQRRSLIDRLHEDFERDLREMSPGRIVWGGWYIECFVTASSTYPDANNWNTENDLTFWCPRPWWVKENMRSFYPVEVPPEQEFLEYDYDYEYDFYRDTIGGEVWTRTFPFESDFRLIVYGEVANPRVVINGHPYQINDTLEESQYLIVDSRNNTIIKYLGMGVEVNDFDLRDKSQSVFQKIPGGSLRVNWSGGFGFDLTIYEERSEPTWS